ncbi:hypothetical protein MKX01_004328 [Papaver californicum]|nr:hypothetical protein MKX01_004328 [Papaver californicum]
MNILSRLSLSSCFTNNCVCSSLKIIHREELRLRFPGVPGDFVNFFSYVAEEMLLLRKCCSLRLLKGISK